MKKLLFAFFVLTVVLGSISLQAQDRFSFADDDEREIPLDPVGSKEGGPIARSIIIQPASAYVDSDIVTIVFTRICLLQVLPLQMFLQEQSFILRFIPCLHLSQSM